MRPRAALVLLALAAAAPAAPAEEGAETSNPAGPSRGGGMSGPAVGPADGRRRMAHCDMSGAYVTGDGDRSWRTIHRRELASNTRCRPAWHPPKAEVVFSP